MKRIIFTVLLLAGLFAPRVSLCQDYSFKPQRFKSQQSDSISFYYRDEWISSRDINKTDAAGYSRRAFDKINLGYLKEALPDIDKSLSLDSIHPFSYYLKGYILLRLNQLDSSLENFRKAIALKDTNVYTYFYAAEVCIALNKTREADSLFIAAILNNNKFAEAYFGLGNLQFITKEWDKAEINYLKTAELDPTFAPAYYNLAVIYMEKDPLKSLKYLDKCTEANSSFAPGYYMKGVIYMNLNRFPIGMKNIDKSVELDPANLHFKISKALYLIHSTQYREGIEVIIKAFDLSESHDTLWSFVNKSGDNVLNDFLLQVATFHEFSGELTESDKNKILRAIGFFAEKKNYAASEIFLQLRKSTSSPGLVCYFWGINLDYMKEPDKALYCYFDALKYKPFPFEVYYRRGINLAKAGRYQEATKDLNTYISKYDRNKVAFKLRGYGYLQQFRIENAIEDFSRSLQLDSTDADSYMERAKCYKKAERYEEASRDLTRILGSRNYNIEAACLLADCWYLGGDTTKAYNLLNQTSARFSFLTEEGYLIRGIINLAYKKYDFAIRDFNLALFKNKNNTDALVYRGLAFYCKEQFETAKKDFTEAIKLDQNNITALYTRGLSNIKLNQPAEAYDDLKKAESLGHPLARRARLMYLKDYKPKQEN